ETTSSNADKPNFLNTGANALKIEQPNDNWGDELPLAISF
ncbi:MAG: hypothetical protein ACJATS_000331, partial [Psychroserpens sp.]